MRIEIDEQAPVSLPPVVDDDGDAVTVESVTWESSDAALLTFVPDPADTTKGWFRSTGTVGGPVDVMAHVTAGGVTVDYTGQIEIGLSVPVGGDVTIGAGEKFTP